LTELDLVVRDARLPDREEPTDIGIRGDTIAMLGTGLPEGAEEIDAEGRLVGPTFVESHFHLDKCYTGERSQELLSLEDYIAAEADRKRRSTVEDVAERCGRVIETLVNAGVTVIRTNVDVDTSAELRGLDGVFEAARRYADLVDIQVVAFPQQGIIQDPGTEELLREAMRRGAHAIGGHPQLEICREDSERHLEIVFDLAREFDADVDLHVDETDDPDSTFIHDVAVHTLRRGWQGRVAAGHVCALAMYNPYYADKIIRLIARAGITVVTNPTSNLLFRGLRDPEPRPRGLTRVRELLDAGVRVCYGQETVQSVYIVTLRHPDPLLTAQILAHGAQLKSTGDMQLLWQMPTTGAATALGVKNYGLEPGCRASLNVFDAESVSDAIATIAPRRWVLRDGRVVSETVVQRALHRGLD
jgi:cytosine/creatinine deaminase